MHPVCSEILVCVFEDFGCVKYADTHLIWNAVMKIECLDGYAMLCLFSELYYDRGNHHEFTSLVKELARPGELMQNSNYTFEFQQVEKPYESYTGANVRLR